MSHPTKALLAILLCLLCGVAGWRSIVHARSQGTPAIEVHTLTPPTQGQIYATALSADGRSVATLSRTVGAPNAEDILTLLDVATGKAAAAITLPTPNWSKGPQYSMERPIRFCNQGRSLVAFDGLSTLYTLAYEPAAHTLAIRASIALNALQVQLGGTGPPRRISELNAHDIEWDCAPAAPLAVLRIPVDNRSIVKLFDLDRGSEIADWTKSFHGIWGDGIALSPSGTTIAMDVWNMESFNSGSVIELVDTRTGDLRKRLAFGDRRGTQQYQLAFAGEDTLLIGQPLCKANRQCSPEPSGRPLRLLDLATATATNIALPGHELYRFTASSSDGTVLFTYAGSETSCPRCNQNSGEIKIDDARFTLWNRATRELILDSPTLSVIDHRCPLLTFGSSCTASQDLPQLEMSGNAKSALAFWPSGLDPTPQRVLAPPVIRVYTWH